MDFLSLTRHSLARTLNIGEVERSGAVRQTHERATPTSPSVGRLIGTIPFQAIPRDHALQVLCGTLIGYLISDHLYHDSVRDFSANGDALFGKSATQREPRDVWCRYIAGRFFLASLSLGGHARPLYLAAYVVLIVRAASLPLPFCRDIGFQSPADSKRHHTRAKSFAPH